jgi:hypothetical protein
MAIKGAVGAASAQHTLLTPPPFVDLVTDEEEGGNTVESNVRR